MAETEASREACGVRLLSPGGRFGSTRSPVREGGGGGRPRRRNDARTDAKPQSGSSARRNRHFAHPGAEEVQSDALRANVIAREVPLLVMALPWVGHFQTRNRGTLGGSVAHADPSAEIPLALVVCGGAVVLQSRRRQRRVPAREFFLGALTTQRQPDEMVMALEWPRAAPDAGHAFMEIAQRHGDFAIAAAACSLRLDKT